MTHRLTHVAERARRLVHELVDRARAIVARRHGDLHHRSSKIVAREANHTFYAYGYLHMADTLCFWMRELRQVETLAGLPSDAIPDCIL